MAMKKLDNDRFNRNILLFGAEGKKTTSIPRYRYWCWWLRSHAVQQLALLGVAQLQRR